MIVNSKPPDMHMPGYGVIFGVLVTDLRVRKERRQERKR